MNARQIQELRDMLAAQAEAAASEKPRLGVFSRLLPSRSGEPLAFGLQPAALQAKGEEDALLLSEPLDEPLPVALLLGDLAPRRGAFGQRRESALELFEPAPREPARLTLTAPNGEAVGEIVLHDVMAAPRRRPFESPQHETPFFPEDLQDAPSRRLARKVLAPAKAKPSREVVATVLLAGLAARLAHEEAALQALIGAYAANSIAA